MLPTPDTRHVDTSRIYEPAEDSFLLLDTLTSEATFLRARFAAPSPTPLIVEVGTGSGVVLAFLIAQARSVFDRSDLLALGVDVNRHACHAALETVRKAVACGPRTALACNPVDVVQSDLLASLRPGSVDVLIFNPPYVPTSSLPTFGDGVSAGEDSFAEQSRLLELSYAGGSDGMEVTRRFLRQLVEVLSPTGVTYLLLCAQNKPAEVVRTISEGGQLQAQIVGTSGKTGGWEKLCILRVTRTGT